MARQSALTSEQAIILGFLADGGTLEGAKDGRTKRYTLRDHTRKVVGSPAGEDVSRLLRRSCIVLLGDDPKTPAPVYEITDAGRDRVETAGRSTDVLSNLDEDPLREAPGPLDVDESADDQPDRYAEFEQRAEEQDLQQEPPAEVSRQERSPSISPEEAQRRLELEQQLVCTMDGAYGFPTLVNMRNSDGSWEATLRLNGREHRIPQELLQALANYVRPIEDDPDTLTYEITDAGTKYAQSIEAARLAQEAEPQTLQQTKDDARRLKRLQAEAERTRFSDNRPLWFFAKLMRHDFTLFRRGQPPLHGKPGQVVVSVFSEGGFRQILDPTPQLLATWKPRLHPDKNPAEQDWDVSDTLKTHEQRLFSTDMHIEVRRQPIGLPGELDDGTPVPEGMFILDVQSSLPHYSGQKIVASDDIEAELRSFLTSAKHSLSQPRHRQVRVEEWGGRGRRGALLSPEELEAMNVDVSRERPGPADAEVPGGLDGW